MVTKAVPDESVHTASNHPQLQYSQRDKTNKNRQTGTGGSEKQTVAPASVVQNDSNFYCTLSMYQPVKEMGVK